jgi:hypothetical protein
LRTVRFGDASPAAQTKRVHDLARPDLAELAIAAAELDGNPLAATPELIRAAATAILERHPGADADDVLL